MTKKPLYSLDFILMYSGDRSVTFTASSDDPVAVFFASREIPHLNSSMVSDRVHQGMPVTINLYKNGKPLSSNDLSDEIRRYYEARKRKE